MPSNWLYRGGIVLVFAYFLIQVVYFACNVPYRMPPDEGHHVTQIELFQKYKKVFLPVNEVSAYSGERSRSFFIYHLLMGGLLSVNSWIGIDKILYLRLINACLGAGYFYVFFLLVKMVLKNRLMILLALLLHACLLMFTFLCGAVNSDNLVNLVSILSVYWTIHACMYRKVESVWLAGGFLLFGCLVKQTFLPLAVALSAILLWYFRASIRELLSAPFRHQVGKNKALFRVGVVVVLTLLLANVFFHGKNILQYGRIKPRVMDIYGEAQAYNEHPIYKKFITLKETAQSEPGERLLDPIRYAFVWSDMMVEKVIGIFAYWSFYPPKMLVGFYELLMIVAIGGITARYHTMMSLELKLLLIPLIFYVLVLMYFVNFRNYQSLGLLPRYTFIGLQGRYIFPVIAPLIILLVRGILSFQSQRARVWVAIIVSLPIFLFSFPYYYCQPNPNPNISNQILQDQYVRSLELSQRFIHP